MRPKIYTSDCGDHGLGAWAVGMCAAGVKVALPWMFHTTDSVVSSRSLSSVQCPLSSAQCPHHAGHACSHWIIPAPDTSPDRADADETRGSRTLVTRPAAFSHKRLPHLQTLDPRHMMLRRPDFCSSAAGCFWSRSRRMAAASHARERGLGHGRLRSQNKVTTISGGPRIK